MVSQDIYPRVGLLDLMAALFLVFKGNCILFSMMAAPIYIPSNSVGGFSFFSTPSPAFIVCRDLLIDGLSDQCEVILHCSKLCSCFDSHTQRAGTEVRDARDVHCTTTLRVVCVCVCVCVLGRSVMCNSLRLLEL